MVGVQRLYWLQLFYVSDEKINKIALIDQFGESRYASFTKVADYWHFFKNLIKDPESKWWDDVNTKMRESKQDIVTFAIKEMLHDFNSRFGKESKLGRNAQPYF